MAKCAFCGVEHAPLSNLKIENITLKACGPCLDKYKDRPQKETVKAALEAGFSKHGFELQNWLEYQEQWEAEKAAKEAKEEAKRNRWREAHRLDDTCPKCGGGMFRFMLCEMLYYERFLPTLDITKFNTNRMPADIHRCEKCGYSELFIPDSKTLRLLREAEDEFQHREAEISQKEREAAE